VTRPGLVAWGLAAVVAVLFAPPIPAGATTLAGRLHRFIDRNGFVAHGTFDEAVTPIVERLALVGIDFPSTATTPAFTYEFDFDTGVPVRTSQSLGPVYVERAETVGRNRLALGVSHLYADLDHFNGHDFADDIATASVAPGGQLGQGFQAQDFSLESHVTSLSLTYGLTNAWDVNLLVPVVQTSLQIDGTAVAIATLNGHTVEVSDFVGFDDSAVGLGDVRVRSKLRVLDAALAHVALGLGIRAPTGNPKDFQGLGDTTVTPSVIVSRAFGRNDVHLDVGVEYNCDDLERTRAHYALGASLQPHDRFAVLIDVIGSSSFEDDDFTFPRSTQIKQLFGNDDLIRKPIGRHEVTAFVPRSDVVNLAFGFKANPIGTLVGFAEVILPLTNDGLRAEVIPTAGLEWTF
jgi:hypothetical protein